MPHREKFHVETWSIVAIVQPNCVYQLIKSVPLLLLYSMQAFIKMSIMVVLLSPHTSQETPGTSLVKQSANQFFFIKFNVELCRFLGIQVATYNLYWCQLPADRKVSPSAQMSNDCQEIPILFVFTRTE